MHLEKLRKAKYDLNHPTLCTLKSVNSTIGSPQGYGPLAAGFQERMAGLWTSQMIYDKQESYIKLLFNLALRWKENFRKFKLEKNLLDYNDMEKYMRQLMQNEAIAAEISQSYRYLFVDEFQDSSPIQVKIFDALSDLMEHSYWVGDYKQAIYGFRGSDIALTKAVVDRVAKKENGCDTDTLDTSWRSLPDIVDVNNAVFGQTFLTVGFQFFFRTITFIRFAFGNQLVNIFFINPLVGADGLIIRGIGAFIGTVRHRALIPI